MGVMWLRGGKIVLVVGKNVCYNRGNELKAVG